MSFLSGYKTYIAAGAGVLAAVAAFAAGSVSPGQLGLTIFAAVLATFVRNGSKADAARAGAIAVAGVVEHLAPIAEQLLPGQAKTIDAIGKAAGDFSAAASSPTPTA